MLGLVGLCLLLSETIRTDHTETAKDGDQEESEDDYEQEGSSSGEQGSSSVQTGWKVLGMFLATLPFITATAAAVWAHSGGSAVGISQ
ncbi:hypothetical protein JZ751_013530 [Albula glossodonta]|uniref:Uncharacterized protein n=1 Tax=Albula glossodonta TaxID=121402 RepID=A0A8T2MLN8_9TELE|nr:hypothetical protein JZ751_013530 [Albula glossodonta]